MVTASRISRPNSVATRRRSGRGSSASTPTGSRACATGRVAGAPAGSPRPSGAGSLAAAPRLGDEHGCRLRPKRTAVVMAYTSPPAGATTICVDELGPVIPRTFPPAPGWSPTGHRLHAPLEYCRGPEKVWVYGALRVRDGQ